jgi:NAD-dependent SIR2 family protein deacetylase
MSSGKKAGRPPKDLDFLIQQINRFDKKNQNICCLVGAGLSAAAGLPVFRGGASPPPSPQKTPKGWSYEEYLVDPTTVRAFVVAAVCGAQPAGPPVRPRSSSGHLAVAKIAHSIITTNVDELEVGDEVVRLHGSVVRGACRDCGEEESGGVWARRVAAHREELFFFEKREKELGFGGFFFDHWKCRKEKENGEWCEGTFDPLCVFYSSGKPKNRFTEITKETLNKAWEYVNKATILLVVGSSLLNVHFDEFLSHNESRTVKRIFVNIEGRELPLFRFLPKDFVLKGTCESILPLLTFMGASPGAKKKLPKQRGLVSGPPPCASLLCYS